MSIIFFGFNPMSPMINLILLIIEVWFLVGILLILHWSSKKVGLTPLLVFMGGLTGALQLQSLGWVTIEVVGLSFNLDSNILLPVLLFGLLIVYEINGTLWAAKRDIRLTYRPLNDLPVAMANANGLSQVLSNLLTNAINYTPAGGRVILETDVKARRKQNWVVISVIDNGTGITDDEIPFIFDRFFRGSASHVTGAEGTGLGLAISKELVTRMGGEITFESSLGEGSSFHVWLRPPGSAML
jgi:signal transduction histidine kinase